MFFGKFRELLKEFGAKRRGLAAPDHDNGHLTLFYHVCSNILERQNT